MQWTYYECDDINKWKKEIHVYERDIRNKSLIMKSKIRIPAWMDSTRRGYFRDQRESDEFLLGQNVSRLILWFVPIGTPDSFLHL